MMLSTYQIKDLIKKQTNKTKKKGENAILFELMQMYFHIPYLFHSMNIFHAHHTLSPEICHFYSHFNAPSM